VGGKSSEGREEGDGGADICEEGEEVQGERVWADVWEIFMRWRKVLWARGFGRKGEV